MTFNQFVDFLARYCDQEVMPYFEFLQIDFIWKEQKEQRKYATKDSSPFWSRCRSGHLRLRDYATLTPPMCVNRLHRLVALPGTAIWATSGLRVDLLQAN